MGMWTYAELSIGIVISCLPVIPKFFQHIGPKVSSALTIRSKSGGKGFGNESASSSPSDKARAKSKIKLPSIKDAFSSVKSNTEKDDDDEMYSQHRLPTKEYVQLREEIAIPKRNATRELIQMPAAKLATTRDDLERGYGVK